MNSLIILFIFVPVLTLILLALNLVFSVHRPDSEKLTSYECGFSPIHNQTRTPFSVQFYLVAILFLVFDLELLVLYPITVTLYEVGSYGFWIVLIFFSVLTVGFVYELGSGALKFMLPQSRKTTNTTLNSNNPFPGEKPNKSIYRRYLAGFKKGSDTPISPENIIKIQSYPHVIITRRGGGMTTQTFVLKIFDYILFSYIIYSLLFGICLSIINTIYLS